MTSIYVVRFQEASDVDYILTNGPWMVANHYLVVQKWKPSFTPATETINMMAVWVRLKGLPIEYMNYDVLWEIGNSLGKTHKVDTISEAQLRGKYVEIDLNKPLIPYIEVDDWWINIEYEGINQICFSCGHIGHTKELCMVSKGIGERCNEQDWKL